VIITAIVFVVLSLSAKYNLEIIMLRAWRYRHFAAAQSLESNKDDKFEIEKFCP